MKTLYFDCSMGAAGDMLTAALLELLPDREGFIEKINNAGIPGVVVSAEKVLKSGISGTHVTVKINGEEEIVHDHDHEHEHSHHEHHAHEHSHTHNGLFEIEEIVSKLNISDKVKKDVNAVYSLIAEAESHAHGVSVREVHFHEVGAMDAVADITAVCLLMEEIGADKIIASPVHVGSGHVHCAHSILPVPTPATAYLLRGCPIYGSTIRGELCTPTGAALLRYFADEFSQMPLMKIEKTGFGMGTKDFEAVNCIRVMLGQGEDESEEVTELECNIDDMTAEDLSFAMERISETGALEVYTTTCAMKKNRQGQVLHIICNVCDRQKVLSEVFRHTSTIGVREYKINRWRLSREMRQTETPYGVIREKVSTGFGAEKSKYEFEDLARAAREHNLTLSQVREAADNAKK